MNVATTSFINPIANEPVVDPKSGFIGRAWLLWLLPFARRVQFNAVDTSTGGGPFVLPLAAKNQNVEIVIKKTTGDANVVVPTPSTGDVVDDATPLAPGNLSARYISDGVSTWYLV